MNCKYDVFEKFSDGSSLWRGCVSGFENTRIHLHELSSRSGNQFYAIDIAVGKRVQLKPVDQPMGFVIAKKVAGRGNQRVA